MMFKFKIEAYTKETMRTIEGTHETEAPADVLETIRGVLLQECENASEIRRIDLKIVEKDY